MFSMETESPFDQEGIWLRCALHAHTTNSDGELAPERLAAHYHRAGYAVLCITDHWVRTDETSNEILVIPGIELNATLDVTESDAHVLALGVESDPVEPGRRFPNLQQTVDWIREHGAFPSSRIRTGAACASRSSSAAKGCSGSRSTTRAASSRS